MYVLRVSVFLSGVAKARVMAYFGEGAGPIHVDNVKCSGEERSLADCIKQAPGTHNCRHSEDAGVICDYGESQSSYKEVKGQSVSQSGSHQICLCSPDKWSFCDSLGALRKMYCV